VEQSFRWNAHNLTHIAEHGVTSGEAQHVVTHAGRSYPRYIGDERWLVWGQTAFGAYLQVVYLKDPDGTRYIIHARPLSQREIKAFRRQHR
jgi:uncharacterized DUF497 family protein